MIKNILLGLMLSSSVLMSTVHADALFVECGKSVDKESGMIVNAEFAISAESVEDLSGLVGGTWNFQIKGEWVPANTKYVTINKNIDKEGILQSVTVKIFRAQITSGPVGHEYIIYRPYSEEKVYAEKYNIGGFTGGIKINSYVCVSASA